MAKAPDLNLDKPKLKDCQVFFYDFLKLFYFILKIFLFNIGTIF